MYVANESLSSRPDASRTTSSVVIHPIPDHGTLHLPAVGQRVDAARDVVHDGDAVDASGAQEHVDRRLDQRGAEDVVAERRAVPSGVQPL